MPTELGCTADEFNAAMSTLSRAVREAKRRSERLDDMPSYYAQLPPAPSAAERAEMDRDLNAVDEARLEMEATQHLMNIARDLAGWHEQRFDQAAEDHEDLREEFRRRWGRYPEDTGL